MKYLNDNRFCVVDISTTGKMPGYHELIEICVLPVAPGFVPDRTIFPFHTYSLPRRPHTAQTKGMDSYLRGQLRFAMDPWDAGANFEHWYDKLNLRHTKRIYPIGLNWSAKQPFIMDWLSFSDEGSPFYYDFFDETHSVDLITLPLYWNEILGSNGERQPFTRQNLTNLCTRFGIPWVKPMTAQTRCFLMLEIYRKFTEVILVGGNILPLRQILPVNYDIEEPNFEVQYTELDEEITESDPLTPADLSCSEE